MCESTANQTNEVRALWHSTTVDVPWQIFSEFRIWENFTEGGSLIFGDI